MAHGSSLRPKLLTVMVKDEGVDGFHPVRWSSLHTKYSLFLNVFSGLLGWFPQTLKYIRVLGGKEYPVILADNCYDQFFEYANGTKSCEGGDESWKKVVCHYHHHKV